MSKRVCNTTGRDGMTRRRGGGRARIHWGLMRGIATFTGMLITAPQLRLTRAGYLIMTGFGVGCKAQETWPTASRTQSHSVGCGACRDFSETTNLSIMVPIPTRQAAFSDGDGKSASCLSQVLTWSTWCSVWGWASGTGLMCIPHIRLRGSDGGGARHVGGNKHAGGEFGRVRHRVVSGQIVACRRLRARPRWMGDSGSVGWRNPGRGNSACRFTSLCAAAGKWQ